MAQSSSLCSAKSAAAGEAAFNASESGGEGSLHGPPSHAMFGDFGIVWEQLGKGCIKPAGIVQRPAFGFQDQVVSAAAASNASVADPCPHPFAAGASAEISRAR